MACQVIAFEFFENIIGKSQEELIQFYKNKPISTFKDEANEKALWVKCRWQASVDSQKIDHVFVIPEKNLIHSLEFLKKPKFFNKYTFDDHNEINYKN